MTPSARTAFTLFLGLTLGAPHVASFQATPAGQAGPNGSILGRAVTRHAREPIADAVVVLNNAAGEEVDAVRTTVSGHFLFTDVPPGNWTIGAVKAGYQATGLARRASVTLSVGEHRRDVEVPLIRFAAVEGTVLDDAGDPVVGVKVQSHVLSGGGWGGWTGSYSTTTDDRGRYRLFLAPNTYTISVPSRITWMPAATHGLINSGDAGMKAAFERDASVRSLVETLDGGEGVAVDGGRALQVTEGPMAPHSSGTDGCTAYRTRFNGNAASAASAPPLVINDGEEHLGVDIRVQRTVGAAVSGVVSSPSFPVASVPIVLGTDDGIDHTFVATTYSTPDGRFTFPCVASGHYVLSVEHKLPAGAGASRSTTTVRSNAGQVRLTDSGPRRLADDQLLYASMPLSVGGKAVEGLRIELQTGHRFSGRLVIDDPAPARTAAPRRTVQFWAVEGRQGYFSVDVGEDLEFTSPAMPAGDFYVSAYSADGLGVGSIVVDGRDISDALLRLPGADVGGAIITMARLPSLSGRVKNVDGDGHRPQVKLFPVDREIWPSHERPNRRRVLSTTAESTGAYRFPRVPPGDYFVVALAEDPTGDWRIPSSLDRLSRVAERITIEPGRDASRELSAVALPAEAADASVSRSPVTDSLGIPAGGTELEPSPLVGRVVDAARPDEPLRAARVTIRAIAGSFRRAVLTNDDGWFSAGGIPDGRYIIDASKAAYLTMSHGAPGPGRPGTPVDVNRAEPTRVELGLPRGGVITGRVTNTLGQPFMGARVAVLTLKSTPDGPVLEPAAGAQPDDPMVADTGEYRVYGLPPGRYYVGAAVDQGAAWPARMLAEADVANAVRGESPAARPRDRRQMYAPAFHPSGPDLTLARVVEVHANSVAEAVDIQIDPETAGSVSGRLAFPDGTPAAGVRIALLPDGLRVPGATQHGAASQTRVASYGGIARVTTARDGSFTVTGLPATTYTVGALAEDARSGQKYWTATSLAVRGQDLRDIPITLEPAMPIRGTLDVRSTAGRTLDVRTLSVTLRGTTAGELQVQHVAAGIDTSGAFTFPDVVPGRYQLFIGGLGNPWVAEVPAGGVDLLDARAELGGSIPIEVTITDQAATVSGRFDDASGRPATDYFVVLLPPDRNHWHEASRRLLATRPSADGRYVFGGLPAGDYLMAAVTDLVDDGWRDPTVLEMLAGSGAMRIRLAPGEALVQNIRVGSR